MSSCGDTLQTLAQYYNQEINIDKIHLFDLDCISFTYTHECVKACMYI